MIELSRIKDKFYVNLLRDIHVYKLQQNSIEKIISKSKPKSKSRTDLLCGGSTEEPSINYHDLLAFSSTASQAW